MPFDYQRVDKLDEGEDYSFDITLDIDTTGETLQLRAEEIDGSTAGESIGSVSGVAANTEVTIDASTSILSTGEYYLELYQDYGGSNESLLYPQENVRWKIEILDRFGR